MLNKKRGKALTIEDLIKIQHEIENGSCKASIAESLGKDKSTIGREIKLHRKLIRKCRMQLECTVYKHCKHGRVCTKTCPDYIPFKCTRRDRSPGACNGCPEYSACRFDKYSTIKSVKSALDTHVKEYRSFGYSDSQPASHIIE